MSARYRSDEVRATRPGLKKNFCKGLRRPRRGSCKVKRCLLCANHGGKHYMGED